MSSPQKAQYSQGEELANSITHGIGMIFGIVGLVLLLIKAIDHQADTLTITSMAIYGSSMIVLFLASTLYHAIPYPKAKRWLKTFDHCAIYLLIAGSYTPFLLVSLRTPLASWADDCDLDHCADWYHHEGCICISIQEAVFDDVSGDGVVVADCDLSVGD